jgi:hypothetical protein
MAAAGRLRATCPDAETDTRLYLVKNVSVLRATYQVRLLAYRAMVEHKELILKVPEECEFARNLQDFVRRTGKLIHREPI